MEAHRAVASEHLQSRIATIDEGRMIYLDEPDQAVSEIRFLTATV